MDTTIATHHKNVSTFIHLSTFCKWIFPFGNFIAPLILWSTQSKRSRFIDNHGRNAINFQLSMLLYLISIAVITIPFIIYQAFQFRSKQPKCEQKYNTIRTRNTITTSIKLATTTNDGWCW